MKKKIIAFLCVITCLLSIAGCGSAKEFTATEAANIAACESKSSMLMNLLPSMANEEDLAYLTSNYKKRETAEMLTQITNSYGYTVVPEKGVLEGMLTTYIQAEADMGGIVSVDGHTVDIVGKEIVVTYHLTGNEANGQMKFKFTNDIFSDLTAAEATANLTVKQNFKKASRSMGNAGLNTLLGMGTVFSVLILISLIISSFNLFRKKDKPAPVKEVVDKPEVVTEENLADDTELVAVIMAAISAFEGTTSTDGLVVRSIRRANRRN